MNNVERREPLVENKELNQEQERMDYVVSVIKNESERLEGEYDTKLKIQKELLKESSSIRINNSSDEAMWESSGELREFEQNLTIKSNELNQVQTRRAVLEKMQEDPYFGRINYHDVKAKVKEAEEIYVGMGSLFEGNDNLIVDWRAPISTLYYESNVGEQITLRFGKEFQKFQVDLKRQFRVRDGRITGMIDSDNVMGDPYLLEVLEGGSSNQMGPVISTLQKEQNRIVRETKAGHVLIQGVAGSGKTVVMMQKIAYLLYALRVNLKAEEILLFSPNRIFQAYISQVLPSLGEWNVVGKTFGQFIQQRLPTYKLIPNNVSTISEFTALKGSLDFYNAIERYGRLLKKKHLKFRDIQHRGEVLISKEELADMQKQTQTQGALSGQLEALRRQILSRLRELQVEAIDAKWVDDILQNMDTDEIHQFESETHNLPKLEARMRREIVAQAFHELEKKVNNQNYIRILGQYVHFLRVLPQLIDFDEYGISEEKWSEHVRIVVENMREKKLSLDDMGGFYSLVLQMRGILTQESYQFICIDEIQDFTPFQLKLMKDLYPRAQYVMAGDLNQNIWQNKLSHDELDVIFKHEPIEKHLLLTSYRSTKEIMSFADQFASMTERVAQPIRSKGKTKVLRKEQAGFHEDLLANIQAALAKGERIAVLTPNLTGINSISEQLTEWNVAHQVINQEDDFLSGEVVVMPIGLAKGLEFDVVIAVGTNEILETIPSNNSKQIWYTIFSRAMHQLYVVVSNEETPLLQGISEETYE